MEFDPQAKPILEALASQPKLSTAPLAEGRSTYDTLRSMGFGPRVDAAETEEIEIPTSAGSVRARLYRPSAAGNGGLFVHLHGGGFIAGSIEGYDKESHAFSTLGSCTVLTPEYRLAPENRFPAGVDDAIATLAWAAEHAPALGFDPARLAIGGDSAGANLSAVAALAARDRGLALAFQLLIYPNTDYVGEYDSMDEFPELSALSRDDVIWAKEHYLRDRAEERDWRASPFRAPSLAGVAPALVVTAGCDVLRDEGEAYANRLQAEGVATTLRRYAGLPHGFFSMGAFVDAAREAVIETCETLREALE
jgi:acetyl esterase